MVTISGRKYSKKGYTTSFQRYKIPGSGDNMKDDYCIIIKSLNEVDRGRIITRTRSQAEAINLLHRIYVDNTSYDLKLIHQGEDVIYLVCEKKEHARPLIQIEIVHKPESFTQ